MKGQILKVLFRECGTVGILQWTMPPDKDLQQLPNRTLNLIGNILAKWIERSVGSAGQRCTILFNTNMVRYTSTHEEQKNKRV